MNKKITSVFLIYFLQFLFTSCGECDPTIIYEKTYNGLEIKGWDERIGFISPGDSVNKDSFGLVLEAKFDLTQVAYNQPVFDLSSFGYSSAYATSDNCVPEEYIYTDPITSILIFVTDTDTQETIDVTNNFTLPGYGRELLTINDLLEEGPLTLDAFQVDMTKTDNIPDKAIFTAKYTLESGTELVDQTQEVIFK